MSTRLHDGSLVLTPIEQAGLAIAEPVIIQAWLAWVSATGRQRVPGVWSALVPAMRAGRQWGSAADSAGVPRFGPDKIPDDSESRWLTVREAADRLGTSTRRVTALLREHRIYGEQAVPDRSAWRVSEQSVDTYRTERDQRMEGQTA